MNAGAPVLASQTTKLVSIGAITHPKVSQSGPRNGGSFTYVDISSIDNKLKRIVEPKTLSIEAAPSRAKQVLSTGDVIVSMTRPNLNAVAIVPPSLDGAIGSTGFHVLRSRDTLPEWLFYAVQSNDFVDAMCRVVQGALYPAVRPKDILAYEIPHPPMDEQRRIVAEIEKQFTRLEAGVAALQRVQANLKRYRASVLKAACESRLVPTEVELARAEDRSYESADELLARILNERRQKWSGRGKYKEPTEPDTSGLSPLPSGWKWASLEQLSWSSAYGTSAKCSYENSGFPVLRIPNVGNGVIDLNDLKFAATSEELEPREALSPGDLLIIRTNGSKGLIGRSAVVREQLDTPTSFASYLIRFRLINVSPLFAWVGIIWDVSFLRAWIEQRAATSAGQHNISMSVLATMPIPLPPAQEQKRISAEVERRLSVVDRLEAVVAANLQRATRLRLSILNKSFRLEQ